MKNLTLTLLSLLSFNLYAQGASVPLHTELAHLPEKSVITIVKGTLVVQPNQFTVELEKVEHPNIIDDKYWDRYHCNFHFYQTSPKAQFIQAGSDLVIERKIVGKSTGNLILVLSSKSQVIGSIQCDDAESFLDLNVFGDTSSQGSHPATIEDMMKAFSGEEIKIFVHYN